jgi:hypothetical protein
MTIVMRPLKPAVFLIILAAPMLAAVVVLSPGTLSIIPTTPPDKMTVADVRAAIADAARRREEALRPDPALSQANMIEKWGVEVIGLNRTLANYMLDFQVHVVNLEKARPLFDARVSPYVLTERTGTKLPVPMAEKIGALRPTNRSKNIKAGSTYHILFANPDSHVKPGETATVVIGDFKAAHLTIR